MYSDLQDLMQAPRSWQKLPSRQDEYTIPRNEVRSMVRSKAATRTLPHGFCLWSGVDDTIICPKLMQTASATVT